VNALFAEAEAGTARLFMSAINAGEVYYYVRKYHSETLAESWRESSRTLPVTTEVPTAAEIWDAALLKGKYPIAYADAFAAALAQKYRCPLVTGDPEFRSVPDLELDWIGPATAR
jgi:ribonuclease VapC